MKRLKEKDGRKCLYIQRDDLVSLLKMTKFISKELNEKIMSLLASNMHDSKNELYFIDDINLIDEIYSYPFIVDYDEIKDLSKDEISSMILNAINDTSILSLILKLKYNSSNNAIIKKHKEFLDNCSINTSILDNTSNKSITVDDKIDCINIQSKNYINNLEKMYKIKQNQELEELNIKFKKALSPK